MFHRTAVGGGNELVMVRELDLTDERLRKMVTMTRTRSLLRHSQARVFVCMWILLASSIVSAFVSRTSRRWRGEPGPRAFSLVVAEDQHQPHISDDRYRPMPMMPSDLFISLAESQMELLEFSLPSKEDRSKSKVSSMALYFPRENTESGQLEFFPLIPYPKPVSKPRVFIATDDGRLTTPTFPTSLAALPGSVHASSVLPGYPMMLPGESASVGAVEEVMCDAKTRSSVLSVPLLSGPQTIGALLVWPRETGWTFSEKERISRAAQSMATALSMDMDRSMLRKQAEDMSVALSDSLHQIKNPLQALRMYGKLLQRQVYSDAAGDDKSDYADLARQLLVQSDRVVDLLSPMDSIVHKLDQQQRPPLALCPPRGEVFPEHLSLNPIPKQGTNSSFGHDTRIATQESHSAREYASVPNVMVFGDDFGGRNETGDTVSTSPRSYEANGSQPKNPSMSECPVLGVYEFGGPPQKPFPPVASVVANSDLQMSFVSDVLGPILLSYEVLGREKGINIAIDMNGDNLPGVLISPRSLQEAVSNVVDNAIKYVVLAATDSPFTRNPSPKIRVVVEPNDNDEREGVTIWVRDNGPGIALSDRDKIFERGFRGEQTRDRAPGTGIGLSISHSLVERMGGSLDLLESNTGPRGTGGAAFRFKLYRRPTI